MMFTNYYYSFKTESQQIPECTVLLKSHILWTSSLYQFDFFHLQDHLIIRSPGMFESFCNFNIRNVPLNAWISRSWNEGSTVMVQSILITVKGKVQAVKLTDAGTRGNVP